jgi:tripartite-type tricarboxylate transporter receptor subunit TctC
MKDKPSTSMRFVRGLLVCAGAAFTSLIGAPVSAQSPAQTWPQRPIHMLISGAAGASNDVLARVLFQNTQKTLGQPMVIDNRPGAFGNIAGAALARADSEGYTYLLTTNGPLTLNKFLYKGRMQYDPLRDFAPVAVVAEVPLVVVVRADLPVDNLQQLVELSKKKPKGLSFGSPGAGSLGHLTGELFRVQSGANGIPVPFNGSPAAQTALLGGQIEVVVDTITQFETQIRSRQVKMLAILSAQRSPDFPDVPTAIEQGFPDMDVTIYYAIVAPKNVPAPVLARMNAEVNSQLEQPEVRTRLKAMSLRPVGGTPRELADRMSDKAIEKWRLLIARIGFRLE